VFYVPFPQTARFNCESEQPFEPDAHHPSGGLFYSACMKIKSNSYCKHYKPEFVPMSGNPAFLTRTAESDEKNTRTRFDNLFYERIVFFCGKLAKRR
jgi:hypothetical protein